MAAGPHSHSSTRTRWRILGRSLPSIRRSHCLTFGAHNSPLTTAYCSLFDVRCLSLTTAHCSLLKVRRQLRTSPQLPAPSFQPQRLALDPLLAPTNFRPLVCRASLGRARASSSPAMAHRPKAESLSGGQSFICRPLIRAMGRLCRRAVGGATGSPQVARITRRAARAERQMGVIISS